MCKHDHGAPMVTARTACAPPRTASASAQRHKGDVVAPIPSPLGGLGACCRQPPHRSSLATIVMNNTQRPTVNTRVCVCRCVHFSSPHTFRVYFHKRPLQQGLHLATHSTYTCTCDAQARASRRRSTPTPTRATLTDFSQRIWGRLQARQFVRCFPLMAGRDGPDRTPWPGCFSFLLSRAPCKVCDRTGTGMKALVASLSQCPSRVSHGVNAQCPATLKPTWHTVISISFSIIGNDVVWQCNRIAYGIAIPLHFAFGRSSKIKYTIEGREGRLQSFLVPLVASHRHVSHTHGRTLYKRYALGLALKAPRAAARLRQLRRLRPGAVVLARFVAGHQVLLQVLPAAAAAVLQLTTRPWTRHAPAVPVCPACPLAS